MIPAMYFFGLFDLARRFLNCLHFPTTPMVAQLISSIIHILLCYLFIARWSMGVKGLGYATLMTCFNMFSITAVYAVCTKETRMALSWPNKDAFINWGEYLRISVPSTIMMLAEGWAINILGLFAGLISVNDCAGYTLLLNLS